jgi:hypothetical protein
VPRVAKTASQSPRGASSPSVLEEDVRFSRIGSYRKSNNVKRYRHSELSERPEACYFHYILSLNTVIGVFSGPAQRGLQLISQYCIKDKNNGNVSLFIKDEKRLNAIATYPARAGCIIHASVDVSASAPKNTKNPVFWPHGHSMPPRSKNR